MMYLIYLYASFGDRIFLNVGDYPFHDDSDAQPLDAPRWSMPAADQHRGDQDQNAFVAPFVCKLPGETEPRPVVVCAERML